MSRASATGHVVLAYVVALGLFGALLLLPPWELLLGSWHLHGFGPLLIADLAATLVIFGFSVGYRNASFYDAYWSVLPPCFALYWLAMPDEALPSRQVIVTLGVLLWAIRLTANWWRGWTGLDHEDWRYGMLREQSGALYPLVNLTGIHVFPTIQVFLASLPMAPALAWSTRPLNLLDLVATLVLFGAVGLNHVADEQLRAFRNGDRKPEDVLDTGLWAYSRHPNYLGEMGFWWGLALYGLAADPSAWWVFVGAVAITAMFAFASIPMIEKRMVERRPKYREVIARVPMLLGFPRR